jgi:hypothetical protein
MSLNESIDIDNHLYAIGRTGGSIGSPKNNSFTSSGNYFTIVYTGDDKDDLKDRLKRYNKSLTAGEKSYYGIKYKLFEITPALKKQIQQTNSLMNNSNIEEIE